MKTFKTNLYIIGILCVVAPYSFAMKKGGDNSLSEKLVSLQNKVNDSNLISFLDSAEAKPEKKFNKEEQKKIKSITDSFEKNPSNKKNDILKNDILLARLYGVLAKNDIDTKKSLNTNDLSYQYYKKAQGYYEKYLTDVNQVVDDVLSPYSLLYEQVVRPLSVLYWDVVLKIEDEKGYVNNKEMYLERRDAFSTHEITLMNHFQAIKKTSPAKDSPSHKAAKAIKNAVGINDAITFREDLEAIIVKEIGQAKKEIYLRSYSLSNKAIIEALIEASKRGVKVRIITGNNVDLDKEYKLSKCANTQQERLRPLLGEPNIVFYHFQSRTHDTKMHIKDIVIDHKRKITGSFNFSENGNKKNLEQISIIYPRKNSLSINQSLVGFNYIQQLSNHMELKQQAAKKTTQIILKITKKNIKQLSNKGFNLLKNYNKASSIHERHQQHAQLLGLLQKMDKVKGNIPADNDLYQQLKNTKKMINEKIGINRLVSYENRHQLMKDRIFTELSQAKKSIHITMYELQGKDIFNKLMEKAKEKSFDALNVILCERSLQATSTKNNIGSYYNNLRELIKLPKVTISTYKTNSLMHIKQVIIDDNRVLEGSINLKNIGKNYEVLDMIYPIGNIHRIENDRNIFRDLKKEDKKVRRLDEGFIKNLIAESKKTNREREAERDAKRSERIEKAEGARKEVKRAEKVKRIERAERAEKVKRARKEVERARKEVERVERATQSKTIDQKIQDLKKLLGDGPIQRPIKGKDGKTEFYPERFQIAVVLGCLKKEKAGLKRNEKTYRKVFKSLKHPYEDKYTSEVSRWINRDFFNNDRYKFNVKKVKDFMEKFHKICGIYPSYKIISINCNASTERNLKQSFFLHNKKNQNPLPKATHYKTLKNHLNEHPDITKKMKKDGIIIPIKK